MVEHKLLHEVSVPEAFDKSIAHIELTTVTNDLSSNMSVSVSASFDVDLARIPLDDGGYIEVNFAIRRSQIDLKLINCHSINVDKSSEVRSAGSEFNISYAGNRVINSSKESKISAAFSVSESNIGGSAGADLKRASENNFKHDSSEKYVKVTEQVEISNDHISIRQNPDQSPLRGKLVNLPLCWKVIPKNENKPYAILAELNVKSNWIDLSSPNINSNNPKLGALKSFFSSKDLNNKDVNFHKTAFDLLLKHLIVKGIQRNQDAAYATLAASAIVCVPSDDPLSQLVLNAQETERGFVISTNKLIDALTSSPRNVRRLLVSEGISKDEIANAFGEKLEPKSSVVNVIVKSSEYIIGTALDEFMNTLTSSSIKSINRIVSRLDIKQKDLKDENSKSVIGPLLNRVVRNISNIIFKDNN